jgi:hypothetical protein
MTTLATAVAEVAEVLFTFAMDVTSMLDTLTDDRLVKS